MRFATYPGCVDQASRVCGSPGCFAFSAVLWAAMLCTAADDASTPPQQTPPPTGSAAVPKSLFAGKVVFLKDALARRDIKTTDETGQHVVLETDSGEIIPILADWCGRAFYQDEQLRDRKIELIGFRHPGVPYLNVIAVYTFNENGERMYTDYWCDVCSIPMYQIQPCECCQGPVRLRFQKQSLPDYIQPPPTTAAE